MGFKYVYSSSYKLGRRRGVVILISSAVNYEQKSEFKDKEGRFLITIGNRGNSSEPSECQCSPRQCDWTFYRQIFDLIATKTKGILICGGEFNVRLNPRLDASSGNPEFKPINRKINALMKELGIIDVWREINPSRRDYTHYSSPPHAVYSRIDYFFIYNRDLHRIGQCDIGPIALSDHSPICISVCLNRKPKSSLWSLNSNILNNAEITEDLKKEIRTYLELNDNGEVAPSMLQDALKAVMRGKIIATTSAIKKLKRQRLHDLEIRLKHLQRDHTVTLDTRMKQEMKEIIHQINDIGTQEIQKHQLFSKQRYYEVGGKSLKLLSYKLSKQQADNAIYKIRNPESGAIECRLEKIQQSFEKFYYTVFPTTN